MLHQTRSEPGLKTIFALKTDEITVLNRRFFETSHWKLLLFPTFQPILLHDQQYFVGTSEGKTRTITVMQQKSMDLPMILKLVNLISAKT